MKICIVTSYTAAAEPRAPRHAVAASRAFPDAELVFVDTAAPGYTIENDPNSLKSLNLQRITHGLPLRQKQPVLWIIRKAKVELAKIVFKLTGIVQEGVFGIRSVGLTRLLKSLDADVIFAHNIETLLPARKALKGPASLLFDCMEYYADMGDSQSALESKATKILERQVLPQCTLITSSSPELAERLEQEYGVADIVGSYNVPPMVRQLPDKRQSAKLRLYWRNSVIGTGQRGLEDALQAMTRLPNSVHLYLQGRPPQDGGETLRALIAKLDVAHKVTILPPYQPDEAIAQAAAYDIGLCLERRGPINHDLTVSNKMFDYHMAGLAVVSSDLPGLRTVLTNSGGGVLFRPGDPSSLAEAIESLHNAPKRLADLKKRARAFATSGANLEIETERLSKIMKARLTSQPKCRSES